MRKKLIAEKTVKGIFTISATFTSLTVLLIVFFLFKEGLGLFGEKPIEKGFVLAVNPENEVRKIEGADVKKMFDGEITNWNQVGGENKEIVLFTINDINRFYSDSAIGENFENLPVLINDLVKKEKGIIAYYPEKYKAKDFVGKPLDINGVTIKGFLTGKEWYPTAEPLAQLGIWPMIMGTLWVCFGAIILALPLGIAAAVYMAEIADRRIRNIMKPVIELLAGIPSVVFGFFGLVIIVPLVQQTFNLPVGETALSGSIILAIMILPTIITISEDALRTCPNSLREASLALGATKWQTIVRIVFPRSLPGITAAVILGIGRAFGETMAVLMVTGNAAVVPNSFLEPVRTLTATIAAELGEAPQGGLHYKALFALGCVLFIITFFTNMLVEWISYKRKVTK
ncbi:MAG: phosphate ABC transporter permease subunit PstC [Bacteroidota bacterium]